uniref:Dihydrolipoamide acetyltransferase component of pyruvate dehydrogenase complex n=1 Tax=Strigamia maritima TaxID=126957 RepID=T1JE26_STRMM
MASLISLRLGLRASSVHNVFRYSLAKLILQHASSFHTGYLFRVKGIPINMPALSPTMTEGTIVKWLKKEGDQITPGDALCDIQTDKAVMAMETEEEGTLAKIILGDDSKDVKIGVLIGLMVAEGEDWKTVEMPTGGAAAPAPVKPSAAAAASTPKPAASTPKPAAVAAPVPKPTAEKSDKMGPAVRGLLHQYGDVLKHVQDNKLTPIPSAVAPPTIPKAAPAAAQKVKTKAPVAPSMTAQFIDIPVSNIRGIIAKRLLESKMTIPHAYAATDCIIDGIMTMRTELKREKRSVSMNAFVVKGVAMALQRVPAVNVQWANEAAKLIPEIDISIAVATETGLITPIVKGAVYLSLDQIGDTVKDLAIKARAGKLKPHEFQGGSFSGNLTISNLGMFGISQFTAIINPPQCAILAVGGGRETFNEYLQVRNKMTVNLSYDARAIDEDSAAQFLQAFRDFMENPNLMMTGVPDSLVIYIEENIPYEFFINSVEIK